jgi:hypothetical protein
VGQTCFTPPFFVERRHKMGIRDWDIVTSYVDSVTTSLKTVTFPKVQEQVKVKNQGNANLTYTIGSQSGTLTPGQSVTVNEDISSFSIQAASSTQAFELRAKEKGTEQTEDNSSDVMSQLVDKAKQTDLDLLVNYVKAKNITATPRRTNYLLYDSFARADSTTSIGTAETNNTAYGIASTSSSIWGISNNSACFVSAGGTGRHIVWQDIKESDCVIEADIKNVGSGVGLAFRVTDENNYLYVMISKTYLVLAKRVTANYTVLDDMSPVTEIGRNFTDCKLTIYLKGGKIKVYADGFLILEGYDTFNATNTKHGLFSTGEDPNVRWDNFSIKPLADVPFTVNENFETNLSAWYWAKENPNMSYSQTFSTAIKKSGTQSFRVELRKDDPEVGASKRCEIYLPSESPLEEHWYGVSIYLPNGGAEDFVSDVEREILVQWHNTPDSGESWTSPTFSLMTGENNSYIIGHSWDENRMSTNAGMSANGTQLNTVVGSYAEDKGKWVDWVFHMRWGWNANQNPITEVYKNGKLVYEKNGVPNITNDFKGVYPKLGIYKWGWHFPESQSIVTKRVVYYDDYWIK